MRNLIVISMVTLDGVIQAPGKPEEDTSGGFKHGGWIAPYFDEFFGRVLDEQMNKPFDLLFGRKTYEIWASYWPYHEFGEENAVGRGINRAIKYVASHEPLQFSWNNTILLEGNVVEAVKKLKRENGPQLQVHGSGNLIQTLLKHDLVDELWLRIVPITLGTGKRLFGEGTLPVAFALEESSVSSTGVILASYKRGGEVITGSL